MELEVMKFVAYCGGLTIKLRLDDLQFGHVDRSAHGIRVFSSVYLLYCTLQSFLVSITITPAMVVCELHIHNCYVVFAAMQCHLGAGSNEALPCTGQQSLHRWVHLWQQLTRP